MAPHRALLDAVAPETPVALDSKDLHAVWVNSAALRRAGITRPRRTCRAGSSSGMRTACRPASCARTRWIWWHAAIPKPDLAETTAAVQAATPGMWATGIVALHNANDSGDGLAFRTYQELRRRGELGLRVLQHIPVCNLDHLRAIGLRSGLGDAWLRVGGVKMFADGALGSRTASMLQPYVDEPNNWGVAAMDPEEMLEQALAASAAGLSLTIHAIGDRANRDVLNVLAEVRRQEAIAMANASESADWHRAVSYSIGYRPSALRHRIEHVQCIHPDDLPRLAAAGRDRLRPADPRHVGHADGGPVLGAGARAGRLSRSAACWTAARSWSSAPTAPIEPHAPLIGIHAAVTRRRGDGSPGAGGLAGPGTHHRRRGGGRVHDWPAYAAGEEGYRGSITPGKVADLVVLSQDIFAVDPMAILETPVDMTVLDGTVGR